MRLREVRGGPVARSGRLLVLVVLAAGFLTMHGFFVVSASADTHLGQQHGVAAAVPTHAAAGLTAAPDRPEPSAHHLVAGCVVALVGVGMAGLALLLLRRSTVVQDVRSPVRRTRPTIGVSAPQWFPPRVALCVIRV